jgi:hypothetical protein
VVKSKKQSSEWYTFCRGDYEHYVKYIVNMVLVMEYPHKENVLKLTLNDYGNWRWKLLTAWCWTLENLYSWWRQLVIWKKNDIQKKWLSYEGCKGEEKVKKGKKMNKTPFLLLCRRHLFLENEGYNTGNVSALKTFWHSQIVNWLLLSVKWAVFLLWKHFGDHKSSIDCCLAWSQKCFCYSSGRSQCLLNRFTSNIWLCIRQIPTFRSCVQP